MNVTTSTSAPWSRWLNPLVLVSLTLAVVLYQWPRSDPAQRSTAVLTAPPVLPRPEVARFLAFGLTSLWADWYWLQFAQYFGDAPARELTGYDYSDDYLELITQLDPRFVSAYTAASFAMAQSQQDPDGALALMRRGIDYNQGVDLPLKWDLYRAYAGVAFLYKNDYTTAARYFEEAVSLPGAPLVLKAFAAAFYRAGDDWERAIPLWIDVYLTSPTPQVKGRARHQLERMGVWLNLWGPPPARRTPDPALLKFLKLGECSQKSFPAVPLPGFQASYVPLAQVRTACSSRQTP
ncbi:M48 family metallopeptidase [Candidatus Cyanaurora vandensis]|uniref:tetratricopeptide repeat protein n=1 Tax=Candidatus Cyanaurora vandensis TaxID=2714958 RepID=UPI00257B0E33|nr:hypothetical protein [Candidatus Cyanaurora vandensis]